MFLTVNGVQTEVAGEMSLSEYLTQAGYRRERIAVELNLAIVPKQRYDQTILHDGDVLEVVSFMGGG